MSGDGAIVVVRANLGFPETGLSFVSNWRHSSEVMTLTKFLELRVAKGGF
jgi:hypothetical protein